MARDCPRYSGGRYAAAEQVASAVDAVVICTPPATDVRCAIATLAAGKQVYVASGRAAPARSLPCARCSPPGPARCLSGSAGRRPGGALLNLFSHHADLVPFLLGQRVEAVAADLRSVRSEDDTASVMLRLADGTLVQTLAGMASIEADRIEVIGARGDRGARRGRAPSPTC